MERGFESHSNRLSAKSSPKSLVFPGLFSLQTFSVTVCECVWGAGGAE